MAKILSRWWTQDLAEPREDVFWRTHGSGARATTRAKKNQSTVNSCGDLMALDTIGLPFLKVFCSECKNGYNRFTVADLLDKPEDGAVQMYEKWLNKIKVDQEHAGALSWLLIVKRDHREPLVFLEMGMVERVMSSERVLADFYFPNGNHFSCTSLTIFLEEASPVLIKRLAKQEKV